MDDKAKLRNLAAKVGALTRANNNLRDKLRKGVEVCQVCLRSLENRGCICGDGDVWCTTCYNKRDGNE